MGHSNIRIKARRRKVASLAAMSRDFTVKNCTIPKSDKEIYQVPWDTITNKLSRFNVGGNMAGKYYLKDKKGNLKRLDYSWEHKKYPQMKNEWTEIIDGKPTLIKSTSLHKDPTKMTREQYIEKLIEHKIARWDKKNPCPVKNDGLQDDVFNEEYMIPWKDAKQRAISRIHVLVLSLYDKLPLTGRFKRGEHKFEEKLVAELKDKAGEGHNINSLDPKKSGLLKKAQEITNTVHAKDKRLIATNLRDHKRQKGRIILPKAA